MRISTPGFRQRPGTTSIAFAIAVRPLRSTSQPRVASRTSAECAGDAGGCSIFCSATISRPSLCAAQCQAKSALRTLNSLDAAVQDGEVIAITASARSFLHLRHHVFRPITGSLKLVGEGKWRPADLQRALEERQFGRPAGLSPRPVASIS